MQIPISVAHVVNSDHIFEDGRSEQRPLVAACEDLMEDFLDIVRTGRSSTSRLCVSDFPLLFREPAPPEEAQAPSSRGRATSLERAKSY